MASHPLPRRARHRRTHLSVALAGLAAFVATLVIPAIAALWWLLAVATVVSLATVTGTRLRPRARGPISPGAAGAPGR